MGIECAARAKPALSGTPAPWATLAPRRPCPSRFQILRLQLDFHLRWWPQKMGISKISWGGPSRQQRSKTWRSPSSPHIHQKYIYMWNNSYRTPTECWQKTTDLKNCMAEPGLGALTGCQAWDSEVGEASSEHWSSRDFPAPRNINQQELSQISVSKLRPSYTQQPSSSSAGHPMPNT